MNSTHDTFPLTVFMLVKTQPEWLGMSPDERVGHLTTVFEPIIAAHRENVRFRFFDIEFYATRVTDVWMWEARDHRAYELLVEAMRETPIWDHWFSIVEILPGVENAYVGHDGREALAA
jgi:hypothetical protein